MVFRYHEDANREKRSQSRPEIVNTEFQMASLRENVSVGGCCATWVTMTGNNDMKTETIPEMMLQTGHNERRDKRTGLTKQCPFNATTHGSYPGVHTGSFLRSSMSHILGNKINI